jgi:hypothetical protein
MNSMSLLVADVVLLTETYHGIAVSEKFLHASCVLTLTTSSLFIGF